MTLPQTVDNSAILESTLQKCTVCKFRGPPEAFSGRKLCPTCREYYRNRAANQKKAAEIQAANVDSAHRCCTNCFQVKPLTEYDGTKKSCNPCLAYCKTKYKKQNGRTCTECGNHKLVSEFAGQQMACNTCLPQPKAVYDAKHPDEPSTQSPSTGRRCPRCHRRKPLDQFANFREVCNPCHGNARKLLDNMKGTELESMHFGRMSGERNSGLQIVRLHPELEQEPDRQNESVTNIQDHNLEEWPQENEPSLLRDLVAYARLEDGPESSSVGNSNIGNPAPETKSDHCTLDSNVEKRRCAACRTAKPLDAFAGTRKCCIRCLSRYRTKNKRPGINTAPTQDIEIKQFMPLAPRTTQPPARCRWCDTLCPTNSGRELHLLSCQSLTDEIESLEKQLFGGHPSELNPSFSEDHRGMAPSREVKWLLCKMMVDDPSTRPIHTTAKYKMLDNDTLIRSLDDAMVETENEDTAAETPTPKDEENRMAAIHRDIDGVYSSDRTPTALYGERFVHGVATANHAQPDNEADHHKFQAFIASLPMPNIVGNAAAIKSDEDVKMVNNPKFHDITASLTTPTGLILHEISDPNFERVSQSAEPERLES